MPHRHPHPELTADEIEMEIDPASLGFSTTDELDPLQEIVAQPRAVRALELGLGVKHPGYNVYVAGMRGLGRKRMLCEALRQRVHDQPTPPDWVYVNNFADPDRPIAIRLEPGSARQLERDVNQLLERLRDDLPRALQDEDVTREKQRIFREIERRGREPVEDLKRVARENGFHPGILPGGELVLIPLKDGKPMSSEQVEQLSDSERDDIQTRQEQVLERASALMSLQRDAQREMHNRAKETERQHAAQVIKPLFHAIRRRYRSRKLDAWLAAVEQHVLDNLGLFSQNEERHSLEMLVGGGQLEDPLRDYRVNVLVDNSELRGAPVVIEDAPNYKNLFGIVDRSTDRLGRYATDFTQIRAGSLLRAGGGFLVLNLVDALIEPVVWKELKRTLKTGQLQVQVYEPLGMFPTTALKPEPIPLEVKLVAVGSPRVYHILYRLDEDFREIFKVKAELDPELERDGAAATLLGRLLQRLRHIDGETLKPFGADAVAELLRAAARLAGHRDKMTAEFTVLADLAREATYWAQRDGAAVVAREHVQTAIDERIYRSDLIAHKVRELIREGALRVHLDGVHTGQVNGLGLADLGDYAFARPIRVTASIGVGTAGIINIERESRLSGRAHDKGVFILEGYLRNTYTAGTPLALSASLAMEQSYGVVEGDSATAAELLTLISALSELPLRQDIAVTGSVNQWGEVQAVGGVNEKIEGFFDVCREHGLTREQGVIIPASNVQNLVLRPDVMAAMRNGSFHIWPAEHIDTMLEILTGVPAGSLDDEDSCHGRVVVRLRELVETLRQKHLHLVEMDQPPQSEVRRPADPLPRLPGEK